MKLGVSRAGYTYIHTRSREVKSDGRGELIKERGGGRSVPNEKTERL